MMPATRPNAAEGNGCGCLLLMAALITGLLVALRLSGVIAWAWWWVAAPLLGAVALVLLLGISSLLIAATLRVSMRRTRQRAGMTTTVKVTMFRRAGGPGDRTPSAITVDVRIILNEDRIDWSLAGSREQLTDQVMQIIEGECTDIRETLDDELRQQGWA
jgi:hypothetical protein